jgi:hypothetical protein
MDWKGWAEMMAGVALAAVVGFVNTHTDEVPIVLATTLVATGLLGLAQPRAAWRWGMLVALAVPISQVAALLFGWRVPYSNDWSGISVTLVALIPGLIGAYAGALTRGVLRQLAEA